MVRGVSRRRPMGPRTSTGGRPKEKVKRKSAKVKTRGAGEKVPSKLICLPVQGCRSLEFLVFAIQLRPACPIVSDDCTVHRRARYSPWSISLHAPAARCDPSRVGRAEIASHSSDRYPDGVDSSTIGSFLAHGFWPARRGGAWPSPDQGRVQNRVLGTSDGCSLRYTPREGTTSPLPMTIGTGQPSSVTGDQ